MRINRNRRGLRGQIDGSFGYASTRERLFSTRATQEAQVIPSTGKVHLASLPGTDPGGGADDSGGTCRAAQLITFCSAITVYR
jgi:hypothetical protein